MKASFLKAAQHEAEEAVASYNAVRLGLGDRLRDEVDAAIDRIEFWPHAWSRASAKGTDVPDQAIPVYRRVCSSRI
jgi:hypothetical protein